jgi:DNA-binding NarL/FixJ family response regulator
MPASLLKRSLQLSPGSAVGTTRVAIAHGQRLVRAGLRVLLEREAGIEVIEAATGDEAVAVARRLRPDVLLMDVQLPGLGCVEATRRILAGPPIAVVVLAATETDARVFATLQAGASGLLVGDREPAALVQAVRRLSHGGRARAPKPRSLNPVREDQMLTPKVIEIRRGSAHTAATVQPKAGVTPAA